MKLPLNLSHLLRQRTVESERIEYKAGWNPDPILRTLCAFANDFANLGSGYLVIGQDCDADGRPVFPPVGLAESRIDKIQQELLAACQLIQPPYFPALSVEHVEGRHLIVLQAPGGMHRPYKAPASVTAKHKTWHYYIRRYGSTVEAKGADEQELLSLTANVPWDDRLAQQARVEDLSRTLMLDYLREVGSALADDAAAMPLEALGRQMNVVGGTTEAPRPKNVGLLFFNEAPDRFFPYTQIDVVWFPEGAGGDRFEEKIFNGPLARMTREALGYIQRNFLAETVKKHPDRAEATRVWNFPYVAIEEALVNAVYHRAYEEREHHRGAHQPRGVGDPELSWAGAVDPPGGLRGRARGEPALSEPPHRRVSEGAGADRRAQHGRAEDPEGDGGQRLAGAAVRDGRRPGGVCDPVAGASAGRAAAGGNPGSHDGSHRPSHRPSHR